ncbi:MAG TPA: 16S rRNA (guanine(966)-N(2))-methyltransferase RsmD [Kofleriaceae bacterium]|nr:16S rRNA (guanine(966)-N(2))-methyltransferase RsmD [Kofleriaceae bacterium]
MRIIGGTLGGRRLKAPAGATTRPTSDRVREALFSILGPPPAGARVLDLCAGSGALGLEALSRGAAAAVFVDRAAAAIQCIRANVESLGLADASRIHRGDAVAALRGLTGGDPFTWVFIDPPYASDAAAALLSALGNGALLAEDARIIVEHDRRNEPDSSYGCLVRTGSRRYGDTVVSFYSPAPR